MRNRILWIFVILSAALLTSCGGGQPKSGPGFPGPSISRAAPAEAEALDRKAEQEFRAGKVGSAISLWERIVQNYPDTALAPKGLHKVGKIYLDQGQPDRALQFFDYLMYTYPKWDGMPGARFDRLRALRALGKKKEVMKEAMPLWDASSGYPDVQLGLSRLMAEIYMGEKEIDTAFEWATIGFGAARRPEEQKMLTKTTIDVLNSANEATIRKLLKANPPENMKIFLEFRLAQLDMEKGQKEQARERLRDLLAKNPSHPLASDIQAAIRGTPVTAEVALPLNPNRIGALLPMNGQYRKYGDLVMRGLSIALDEWSGRHSGQKVTLVARDSQGEGDAIRKSFDELAREEGVIGIIGPLGVQSAKTVIPLANKYGVPLITLTQKEEEPEDNSFVVHVFLDNRELVRSLVSHCRQKLGFTRFATLYPDDRYGQRLSKIFAEVVKEEGGELLASVAYKEKTTDFKDSITKLMTVAKQNVPPTGIEVTPFEAVFIPDQVQTVSLIAPQFPYYNVVGATLLGTNLWGEAPLVQAGGAYVEHAIFATPFFPESDNARVRAFREKYQAIYGNQPSYLEAQAYDAMMLFLEAHSSLRGQGADRMSLMQNLTQIHDFPGVAGVYSFTPQGDLKRNYQILQVSNGELVQVSQ